MDEEYATKIAEREVEAFLWETEQENINSQGPHSNMDGADDGDPSMMRHMWMINAKYMHW